MYSSKINFYVPGAFTIPMELLSYLNEAYKNHKEMLRDNINIGCIYGSPGVIWNGGHYINGLLSTYELEDFKHTLEEWDIPLRFTFSNSLIEEKHLHDFFSNQLVEMFATGKNEIICNSPLLEDYLRNKYGDTYKYISSTTKCLEGISEQVDEIDKDYNLVKGGGGALLQEKIAGYASDHYAVLAAADKLVSGIGPGFKVPVEVVREARITASKAMMALGAQPEVRMAVKKMGPVITDNGNILLDLHFDSVIDPPEMEKKINMIPGVVETGLFTGLKKLDAFIGYEDGTVKHIAVR